MKGKDTPFLTGKFEHVIDRTSEIWNSWEEWCEKVVWWGNKKGAYLYNCTSGDDDAGSEVQKIKREPFGNDARYQ
jgi:hypothetical protein